MRTGSGSEPASPVTNMQSDLDPFDPSCVSVSMAAGKKLRRQVCRPQGMGIKRIINFFVDFFRSHPPKQPTTLREDPQGLLPDAKTGNDRIFEEDNKQMNQWLQDAPVNPSLWNSYREAGQGRAHANPNRMIAVCCLGPPASLYQQQKRAETPGIDMQNCELFLDIRPLCVAIGLAQGYCFNIEIFGHQPIGGSWVAIASFLVDYSFRRPWCFCYYDDLTGLGFGPSEWIEPQSFIKIRQGAVMFLRGRGPVPEAPGWTSVKLVSRKIMNKAAFFANIMSYDACWHLHRHLLSFA